MPDLPFNNNPDFNKVSTIYPFVLKDLDLKSVKLKKYKNKICIIVNVASKTKGFTDYNYKLLNKLYEDYSECEGLRILAFPCNQFNSEEPGTNEEIKKFTQEKGVKFDLFDKIEVNGDNAHPLWKFLKKEVDIGKVRVIREPFTKFIVNRRGVPVARLGPEAQEIDVIQALQSNFVCDKHVLIKDDVNTVILPPPLEDRKQTPCWGPGEPWHFEPGYQNKLI